MSGRALRSDSAHTRCSFRSDYDIKQEPVAHLANIHAVMRHNLPVSSPKPPPHFPLTRLPSDYSYPSCSSRAADDPGRGPGLTESQDAEHLFAGAGATFVGCRRRPVSTRLHPFGYFYKYLYRITGRQQLLFQGPGFILELGECQGSGPFE